ncbi:MAG: hypothetical protein RMY36_009365 [Nostoc sp. SerVER01]|nr:hypothetical protein [Nostoc sp. SerVER01]
MPKMLGHFPKASYLGLEFEGIGLGRRSRLKIDVRILVKYRYII